MKNGWFNFIFIILATINSNLLQANDIQPEKPSYWQRFKSGTQSTAEAFKGAGVTGTVTAAGAYAGTRVSGTMIHELGHALVGAMTGLQPTGIEITGIGRGEAKFKKLPVGIRMRDIPNRMLTRQILPTGIAGPAAGAYFNYLILKKLANDEINKKESLKDQFIKRPGTVGITAAASVSLLQNMLNTTILHSDGKTIIGSITTPLFRNKYLISGTVAAGSYITTSLLGTIGTAWWIRNHLYKQWGFEKHPIAQEHLEITPVEKQKTE